MKQSGKRSIHQKKYFRVCIHKTVHGGRFVALNRKFVSTSFNQIVNIQRKYLGKEHEISTILEKNFRKKIKLKKTLFKKI